MQICYKVTFQLMVMILKIKAPIRNLCIVCSVTTPNLKISDKYSTPLSWLCHIRQLLICDHRFHYKKHIWFIWSNDDVFTVNV